MRGRVRIRHVEHATKILDQAKQACTVIVANIGMALRRIATAPLKMHIGKHEAHIQVQRHVRAGVLINGKGSASVHHCRKH